MTLSGFVNKEQEKSILLLSGFIAAVVLDKAHNLVRKGFPAGFAEMDMNVKGRAADVLHKVGFGGQRGSGCGGAGLAGFIVHRLLLFMRKAPCGSTWGGGCGLKWQSGKVSGFCHLDFATSFFEGVIPCRADTL